MHFAVEILTKTSIPKALMKAHYEELAPMKHLLALDPDWSAYFRMQALGELVFVTLRRDSDDEMIGYMIMVVKPHLHYRGAKLAIDDLHYLLPEYRGQGWGKKLIAFAEGEAKQAGAKIFSMRTKVGKDHSYIFEAMGYELTDLVYIKDLTNAQ
jgi:GNAT superfamily N-acetyltransferase